MTKDIKVFSTPTCPYCLMLKRYLHDNGVQFEEIDLTVHPEWVEKMVEKSGHMGVPQSWIGEEVVIGFDVPKINKLLEIA